jgi:hypothetical protein
MATSIGAATRHDLLRAIRERYVVSSKEERIRILDEFIAGDGLPPQARHSAAHRDGRRRPHGSSTDAYTRVRRRGARSTGVLWEASDRVCRKRLKPLIPILVCKTSPHPVWSDR